MSYSLEAVAAGRFELNRANYADVLPKLRRSGDQVADAYQMALIAAVADMFHHDDQNPTMLVDVMRSLADTKGYGKGAIDKMAAFVDQAYVSHKVIDSAKGLRLVRKDGFKSVEFAADEWDTIAEALAETKWYQMDTKPAKSVKSLEELVVAMTKPLKKGMVEHDTDAATMFAMALKAAGVELADVAAAQDTLSAIDTEAETEAETETAPKLEAVA